jgi:hypothetical protein
VSEVRADEIRDLCAAYCERELAEMYLELRDALGEIAAKPYRAEEVIARLHESRAIRLPGDPKQEVYGWRR